LRQSTARFGTVPAACCSRGALRGDDPSRSGRAQSADGADRPVGERSAMPWKCCARKTMRQPGLQSLLLRHLEEPYAPVVQHNRLRQSHEGCRALSAEAYRWLGNHASDSKERRASTAGMPA
jgi:hypothetical protein